MSKFDWVVFDNGKGRIEGLIREPQKDQPYAFAIQLDKRPIRYGGFDLRSEPDHAHYSVEVMSFGYQEQNNVGNSHPNARVIFSASEIAEIREMICQLFLSGVEKPFPLHQPELFAGKLQFREDWIRQG